MDVKDYKPSILIIADFPNWAYHQIMKFVVNNLSNEYDFFYDFVIFNSKVKSKNPIKRIILKIKHWIYSKQKFNRSYDVVFYLGFYFEESVQINWNAPKVIKGIYTESFPPSNVNYSGDLKGFIEKYFTNTDAMACGSKNIEKFYNYHYPNAHYANMILDENLFKRRRKSNKRDSFIIGWTGNPSRKFKGFYSHILPSIAILKSKYPNIEFKTRFTGPIRSLPSFYENLDLVVIASDADAGPSLFVEASLMDVPSVSTKIGWANEGIIDGVNGYLIEKNIDDIVKKIEYLYLNRHILDSMSNRIRTDFLQKFNKEMMINNWKRMFDEVLRI